MTQREILTAMTDRFRELTGAEADDASDLGIRMKVLAAQLELLYSYASELEARAFPETSFGGFLDRHAAQRGLQRKAATYAQGALQFSRATPAPQDIPLPAGLIAATDGEPSFRYRTTKDGVLPRGKAKVLIPAKAELAGRGGNAASGTVSVLITPASGIASVSNPSPFTGGVDAEEDESLRRRLLESYQEVSNGANAAYYHQAALEEEGITSALVLPRSSGTGTVEVVVTAGGTAPSQEVMDHLEKRFAAEKEISVDVTLTPAQPVTVPVSVEIETSARLEDVKTQVEKALTQYLAGLGVGSSALLAGMIHQVYSLPSVTNCRFLTPAEDIRIEPRQVAVPGAITVSPMGASR